jgi:putative transposase
MLVTAGSSKRTSDQAAVLHEATRRTRERRPFQINAFVVLSDHIRMIWTLPSEDAISPRRYDSDGELG